MKPLGERGAAFLRRAPRLSLMVLGLAVLAGGHGALARLARAESTTPTVQRSASDDAIIRWTQRTAGAPDDREAWVSLGDAFMQKARDSADASYYRRAEAAYQKALGSGTPPVAALVGLAWVHGALHDFEQSVEWARKALKLDAGSGPAHGLLGDAALEQGDYDVALEHYQRMLDIRPDLASYSRGAQLLWLTGDTRKAVRLMEKAMNAGTPYAENTSWAQAQLAQMLWSQGALLSAEQTLEAALKVGPRNHHALATMAKVKSARGDYAGAIDHYQRALAVVPRLETVVALGDVYTVTGDKAAAERQFALAETINRLNRANGVRDDLHMVKFYIDHDRNLARALEEAEAIFRTRKNVYAADTLAWGYYKAGRYEEARTMIRKALARHTPDAEILFHAGMIHAKLGDRGKAQKYLYQALSLNPHFHPVYAATAAATLDQLGSGSSLTSPR